MIANHKESDNDHKIENHFQIVSSSENLKSEQARYNTFYTCTKTFIDTKKLALYGFYLKQAFDIVECVFCKVAIGDWELGDNVLREHLRWSPNCRLLHNLADDNIPIDKEQFEQSLPNLSHSLPRLSIQRCDSYVESELESYSGDYVNLLSSPDYKIFTNRLESFNEWPKSMKQKPKDLSDAGFFYLGKGDQVKCFSCGGGLREWEEDDDPWEQHALYYENCYYLNQVKTSNFIKAVKQKFTDSPTVSEENTYSPAMDAPQAVDGEESDLKLCQICYDEERCAVFFPCMHVIACIKCSYSCDSCPICRSKITSIKRIYFS